MKKRNDEADLQAGEHRPPLNPGERDERPFDVSGRLAARRGDEAEHAAGDEHANADARIAQQPFQALVRRAFPSGEGVPLVRADPRVEENERLRREIAVGFAVP